MRGALEGRSELELAYVVARHLAMLRPDSTPLRRDRLTAVSTVRLVANMLIVLLAVVSTVVTASALSLTRSPSHAPR